MDIHNRRAEGAARAEENKRMATPHVAAEREHTIATARTTAEHEIARLQSLPTLKEEQAMKASDFLREDATTGSFVKNPCKRL